MIHRRHASLAIGAALAAMVAACGGVLGGDPWEEPVDGHRAVTGWHHREVGFGPRGAGYRNVDDLYEEFTMWWSGNYEEGEITSSRLLDRDPPLFFARALLTDRGSLMAVDVIAELRQTSSGRWIVAELRERFYCADEPATPFCE